MIESPLVSVIVPACNAQTTLPETLASIQSQTYETLEILIVDDGSTDRTSEIAEAFCRKESRASLLRKANGGLSSARNAAIAASRGEWLAPLDADDIWHPTAVAKLVSAAVSAQQRPGLVYCWYRDIDETGHLLGSGPRWAFSGPALQRLAYWNTIHSVLLSRQAVEEVGGYDEDLRACEDIMMQLSIARRHPVAVVPEHLLGYRTRPGSMSTNSEVVVQSWRNVNQKLVADCARIPQHVLRWNEGFFERIFAEQSLRVGDLKGTVSHMFRAVRIDPLRWGSYAAYRLTRSATHRIFGRRKPLPRLVFGEVDPRAALPSDADQIGWFAAILRQIDAARLRRLQASERLEG